MLLPVARRRRARPCAVAGVLMFLLAACTPGPAPSPAPTPPPDPTRVVLYGDAIAGEVRAPLAGRLSPTSGVLDRSGPGFAACDVLATIATDAANPDLDVAILQFSGDTTTPCMAAATLDPLRTTAYEADLTSALDALAADAGRTVIVVSSPVRWSASPGVDEPAHHAFQQALADVVTAWQTAHAGSTQVAFVDAGAAVSNAGSFAWERPCLPDETVAMGCRFGAGTITVRAPDGRAFCPIAPQLACPPHYSGGARRFLDTFAAQVLAGL